MKPHAAKSLLLAIAAVLALPLLAETPAKKGNTPPRKPAEKAAPAAAEEEQNPEDIKLPGVVLNRPNGQYLTLEVIDGKFKLSFWNEKKKPVKADVSRAFAHWNPKTKAGEDRTVLNPSDDGTSLRGTTFVRPPYNYPIYLTLIPEEGESKESYVVRYTP